MSNLERDIASELVIDPKKDRVLIEKCVGICNLNGLNASELNARWLKYSMENGNCDIDAAHLDKLNAQLKSAPRKPAPKPVGASYGGGAGVHTKDTLNRGGVAIGQKATHGAHFGSPSAGGSATGGANKTTKTEASSSPSFVTTSPQQKGSPQQHGGSPLQGSPMQSSPGVAITPAANRYHVRDEAKRGKIELSYNEHLPSAWLSSTSATSKSTAGDAPVTITCIEQDDRRARMSQYQQQVAAEGDSGAAGFSRLEAPPPTHVFNEGFRFMHQDLSRAASDMNARIQHLAHEIAAEHGLDATEFVGVSMPSQSAVLTYGRIISESMDGRLNAASVMLEGDDSLSHGYRVRLDLSEVESFALFPGQVCVIEGNNATGQVLVARRILTSARLPGAASSVSAMRTTPLTIMCAAGPFHLCPPAPAQAPATPEAAAQRLETDIIPLVDLLVHARRCQPDVLLLIGPFIDAESDIVARAATTDNLVARSGRDEELFADVLFGVQSKMQGTKTQIVLVPSTRDLHHDPVFPQPPFPSGLVPGLAGQFTFAPNPCTLRVADCVLGVCAEDVMFDLSKNLCVKNAKDRITPAYLFEQQSFYPKYPSEDGAPFDFTFATGLHMSEDHRPDVLISPSRLGRFVKVWDEHALGVNPERLVRAEAAGTFAFLTIQPLQVGTLDAEDPAVAFKDPADEQTPLYFHRTAARTRVDIIRI